MKTIKTLLALIFTAALLFFSFLAASPYLTFYKIKQAVDAEDVQALSSYIDYPALRDNLKTQALSAINAELGKEKNNPFAALGSAFAAKGADALVDALITPENIMLAIGSGQLVRGQIQSGKPTPQNKENIKEDAKNYTASWLDWSHMLAHKKGESRGYIFRRNAPLGWDWKLAGVRTK